MKLKATIVLDSEWMCRFKKLTEEHCFNCTVDTRQTIMTMIYIYDAIPLDTLPSNVTHVIESSQFINIICNVVELRAYSLPLMRQIHLKHSIFQFSFFFFNCLAVSVLARNTKKIYWQQFNKAICFVIKKNRNVFLMSHVYILPHRNAYVANEVKRLKENKKQIQIVAIKIQNRIDFASLCTWCTYVSIVKLKCITVFDASIW